MTHTATQLRATFDSWPPREQHEVVTARLQRCGELRVCIRIVGSRHFLLPLPRNRRDGQGRLHGGGEGWGEGGTRRLPHGPSPRPSPHSQVLSESDLASGERGQRDWLPTFRMHTRELPGSWLSLTNPLGWLMNFSQRWTQMNPVADPEWN